VARTDTATTSAIDWTQCELIEQVPGKVSGRSIVRRTRILPDAIVNSYDAGGTLDDIRRTIQGFPFRKSSSSSNSPIFSAGSLLRESAARRKPSAPLVILNACLLPIGNEPMIQCRRLTHTANCRMV